MPNVSRPGVAAENRAVPLQHRRGLDSTLVLHVLRFQHALVIAQQPRRRENRLVAKASRLQEVIVAAASGFAVAIADAIADTVRRNIVVVFGDAILILAGVAEPGVAQSFGAVALEPVGIVRQVALVQVELLEVLPNVEILDERKIVVRYYICKLKKFKEK